MTKSYNPKSIKKARELVKNFKEQQKPMAVPYSEKEKKEVIRGKIRDRIQIQANYVKSFLTRIYQQEKIKFMISEFKNAKDGNNTEVRWMGEKYPLQMFYSMYQLEDYEYKELIRKELYLQQGLKNLGYTNKDFEKIRNGEYIKEEREPIENQDYDPLPTEVEIIKKDK